MVLLIAFSTDFEPVVSGGGHLHSCFGTDTYFSSSNISQEQGMETVGVSRRWGGGISGSSEVIRSARS